jgi:membrane protease YdiL (CAAX protease family)
MHPTPLSRRDLLTRSGLGLGWLRWRSGRLGSAVLMHALWNGMTFMNLLFLAD